VNALQRTREQAPPPVSVSLAWRRYQTTVQETSTETYEEAEERAWRRLTAELARIGHPLRNEPR
jgi:hypothetical protein